MRTSFFALVLLAAAGWASAQAPAPTSPIVRVRGVILAVAPDSVTVRDRSGETVALALPANLVVQEVYPVTLSDVKAGSYIGVAGMPQADGTQRAIALTVFPEASRGVAEGHSAFDLQPQSTMTNATVAEVAAAASGQRLQLRYKDGEKVIVVPAEAPIVSFRAGDRNLLVPGASVSIAAREIAGKPTAQRINAGRNGFALPY